jgi:hypothetical protein
VTLHVAAVSGAGVVLVGDRLVTLHGVPVSTDTNKLIVIKTPSCMVGVAFAGAAYVGDLPTAAWLTKCITGETIVPPNWMVPYDAHSLKVVGVSVFALVTAKVAQFLVRDPRPERTAD